MIKMPQASAAHTIGDIVNISDNPGSSSLPQMAISENGDIYIIWIDNDDGPIDTFFSVRASGEDAFENPVNLSNDPPSSFDARIAATGEKIFVVWSQSNEIFFVNGALNNDGTVSFSSPRNLSNTTDKSQKPHIAASNIGVYVAWEESVGGSARPPDIFFTGSVDQGQTFGSSINLSNNTGSSKNVRIAAAETNVYVTWQEDTDNLGIEQTIFVRGSTDSGSSFGSVDGISFSGGFAVLSDILPIGTDTLYVVGDDGTADADVFFCKAILEPDATLNFEGPVNVSSNPGFSGDSQFAVPQDGTIYIVWKDDTIGTSEILLAESGDGGANFTKAISLTEGSGVPDQPKIAVSSGDDVFVAWVDSGVDPSGDIIFRARLSGNTDFEAPNNLSNTDATSQSPLLVTSDENGFVAWTDFSEGNGDIFFRDISAGVAEPSTIIIEDSTDKTPKWGRTISIHGSTNGGATESVTVEWGDGSTTPDIEIIGSTWGPVDHFYNKSDTGTTEIMARLLDAEGGELAMSDPFEIDVLKHQTSLSLNRIHSVLQGDDIIVSGILTDTDDEVAVANATVFFNGTGYTGFDGTSTDSDGVYLAQGSSPDSADTLWTFQANYAGDLSYEASGSVVRIFDTAPADAIQFAVSSGSPSQVDLTGFDASIEFDEVTSDGTLFVSSCSTPENPRYSSLDLCLIISSAVETSSDSFAHITISFQNKTLPDGYTADQVDIFHETLDEVVDITESRDVEQLSVTGRTTDFSTFVTAAAIHEPPSEGAIRQQVFVGSNESVFNDITSKTINFGEQEYTLGSLVTISVSDMAANTDETVTETLTANITSSSDALGIQLILEETGIDSAVFGGSFTIHSGESSNDEKLLHAEEGDDISGTYLAAKGAPFKLTIDNVAEAGLIEMNKFVVDVTPEINTPEFDPIGDAYELHLVDAQLDTSAIISMTMSYSNVDLDGADEEGIFETQFRLLQSDPNPADITRPEWIDISLPNLPGSRQTSGLDTTENTVTGTTTFLSNFTIGHNPRQPGGGGGGLPRPGTGILLDAVASVAVESDSDSDDRHGSGGGGGGGNRVVVVTNQPSPAIDTVETFQESYFAENPLEKIQVNDAGFMNADGNEISEASVGQELSITSTLSNHQQGQQRYYFIVLIIDEDGFAVDIAWQEGTVESGQVADLSISWMPEGDGNYTVKLFVWDGFENPLPLSNMMINHINVV
jgi:hypothetical protein